MKINLRTILFLASVLLIVSNHRALAHTDVTVEQARDLIDSTNNLVVVDVREQYEYCDAIGHIPGALNYPWNSGVLDARYEELPMYDPVLVVCRSGGRSDRAANFLDSKGFSIVYDMLGGMRAWIWETAPCVDADSKYGGGTGEPNDPYLIYTAEQLNTIGAEPNDWDKHFKLMANIDLIGYTGTDFNIIGYWVHGCFPDNIPFTGVFDGNGHRISNFTYTTTNTNYIGLFAYVEGDNAEIKDLGLFDPNVDADGGNYVGSLVGRLDNGTISNCYVQGGGISGYVFVGGLVGDNWLGGLTNCYTEDASVSGSSTIGGLAGCNAGWIDICYTTGSVTGNQYVGGLVGDHHGGTITYCYTTASVSGGEKVGGLIGSGSSREVTHSFWDIETSGQITSAGGMGKTTVEMKDPNTFMDAGWDFVGQLDGPSDLWAEPEGGGYPILWWQLSPWPALPFSVGTGGPDNPYLISTGSELNSIGHNPRLMESHFRLVNDIDLTGIDFFIIGSELYPFTGVFDGNGYTISNFRFTSTDTDGIGLFRYIMGPKAEIKDLGLIEPDIDAGTGSFVGSLVGANGGGSLTNCYAEGGRVNCFAVRGRFSGSVRYLGGLVGYSDGSITNCYATASVSGSDNVGGLVGENSSPLWSEGRGIITHCFSSGDVSGISNIGGLVGRSYGTITNCYAMGSVDGEDTVGGLVGVNGYSYFQYDFHGIISNCYSVGSVSGVDNVGGLVGFNNESDITASFWDIQASGQTTSAGGTGKTAAEMQTASTFLDAGWDFADETANGTEDIWWILEGRDYPRLAWELTE